MIRRVPGVFIFLIGLVLAGWIFYNLIIARQPETEGMNPLPAILSSGACLYVGQRWIRGLTAN